MKVILLKEVKTLGHKGDVKNVADGYAMNFLIPNQLAVAASNERLAQLEQDQQVNQAKEQKTQNEIDKLISKLKDKKITIKKEASDKGKLFAAVTLDEILAALKKDAKIELDKKAVDIKEHIKELGEHKVNIKINNKNIEIKIKIVN